MFVVLLSLSLYKSSQKEVSATLIKSFLLESLLEEYRNDFKKIAITPKNYNDLSKLIEELQTMSSSFKSNKFVDIIHLHRLISF